MNKKNILNLKDEHLNNMLPTSGKNSTYPIRSLDHPEIKEPMIKNKYSSRNFCFYGPRCWTNLPIYLKKIENFSVFKKQLKTFYICFS